MPPGNELHMPAGPKGAFKYGQAPRELARDSGLHHMSHGQPFQKHLACQPRDVEGSEEVVLRIQGVGWAVLHPPFSPNTSQGMVSLPLSVSFFCPSE